MYDGIDMNDERTVEQTAQETGVSPDTLRYYERIGLITDVARAKNGHRRYNDDNITWILFLKQLRATGMSIAQMKAFAELRRGGDETITLRREALEQYRHNLEMQVQLIENFVSVIDAKIERHRNREQTLSGEVEYGQDE